MEVGRSAALSQKVTIERTLGGAYRARCIAVALALLGQQLMRFVVAGVQFEQTAHGLASGRNRSGSDGFPRALLCGVQLSHACTHLGCVEPATVVRRAGGHVGLM